MLMSASVKSKNKTSSSFSNFDELRCISQSRLNQDRDVENLERKSKVFYQRKAGPLRPRLNSQSTLFVLLGVLIGFILATILRQSLLNCKNGNSCCPYQSSNPDERMVDNFQTNNNPENAPLVYNEIEEEKRLVFIGVMTAQKYLDTRARSVYETWGRQIPGKMSFFSRSGSSSLHNLPLVSLPGVDDSYPPQKKSFMMLKFMHDNYLEKFEWFMRVDDDVYIRPDRLELFLRSINSSKPQFIGQAGLGNQQEFGLLSLDYDENFCMGGPGIVMSRETLRLVVPHISYCLKNLYSTHEDVEIGRCVRKFANVSCTWAYEMQNIFHHNSSGNQAFTGDLLSREVLRAISLHPIKQFQYQYRVHNFFNQRKILELRHRKYELLRDSFKLKKDILILEANRTTVKTTTIKPSDDLINNGEVDSEFDSIVFNRAQNLSEGLLQNRFYLEPSLKQSKAPRNRDHRFDYEFFTRSLFSPTYISPKRGLEGFWKKALADAVRQLMDDINKNSIERGRAIDFKDILYGYIRHDPLVGIDYIIDILLVYRKYEGRKMTVQVRRHAYVRNTFTHIDFRENDLTSSIFVPNRNASWPNSQPNEDYSSENQSPSLNETFFRRLARLLPDFLVNYLNINTSNQISYSDSEYLQSEERKILGHEKSRVHGQEVYISTVAAEKWINFVVPLSGRWETFKRFMRNYEDVCLKSGESTRLAVVLFENEATRPIQDDENNGRYYLQSQLITRMFQKMRSKYNLGELDLVLVVNGSSFSRSIGCELGASQFSSDSLIFFVDVDIVFTADFLLRARLNTIEFKQVYYPIVYSEYDPDDTLEAIKSLRENSNLTQTKATKPKPFQSHFDFNEDSGYWRQFGFGIVSVYNSDLRRVGGFDVSIVGWGKEDVDLYEKFIRSNLTVFRAVDVGLVHVFHKIECDPALAEEQMIMCLGSKATSIASQRQLARIVLKNKDILLSKTEKTN